MKNFMALSLVLFTSTVFACPNLSGQFACYDEDFGDYTLTISQTGSGKNTIYTVTDMDGTEVTKADGVWRTLNEDGITGQERMFCSGNSVVYEMNGSVSSESDMSVRAEIKLTGSGNLENTATMTFGGQTFPADTQICTRF